MGIVSTTADYVYTFKFLKLLTMPWEETGAYKAGLIDGKGKRVKSVQLDRSNQDHYTPFHRLVYNIKRILPQGKVTNFAAALYLLKEKYNISEKHLEQVMGKVGKDIDLIENFEWFLLDDRRISPGIYRLKENKVLNTSLDEVVRAKDQVRIADQSYPVGSIFGIDVYEATHVRTNQKVYVTASELSK